MTEAEADEQGWRGTDEGGKLKTEGTEYWLEPNTGASNSSGFSALPGGARNEDGIFKNMGVGIWLWSATEYTGSTQWRRIIRENNAGIAASSAYFNSGMSIRCVQ